MRNFTVLAALAVAGLTASSATAAPGDMSVATFLTKAEALTKKGILALASSDLKLLKSEIEGSGNAYNAMLKRDKAAGKPPHSCPPEKTKLSLGADEVMTHYQSYPAAQRSRISVSQGFFDLMKKRFPCK